MPFAFLCLNKIDLHFLCVFTWVWYAALNPKKKLFLNRILIAFKIMHHLLFLIFRILFVCYNAIWMCAFKLFFQCLNSGLIVCVCFQFFEKYIFLWKTVATRFRIEQAADSLMVRAKQKDRETIVSQSPPD